jgi:hypothetical protein
VLRASLADKLTAVAAMVLCASLVIGAIVRTTTGSFSGSVALVLISFYPRLPDLRGTQAVGFFCLVSLVWILVTRDWTWDRNRVARCLLLGFVVAVGCCDNFSFLLISPAVAFAWLLRRYVSPDSNQPYRDLWRCARAHRGRKLAAVSLPAIAAAIIALAVQAGTGAPTGAAIFATRVARFQLQYITELNGPETDLILLTGLHILAASVSLWWLLSSVQSGDAKPYALTAIPITYLLAGSILSSSKPLYGLPAHLMLTANLVIFLALFLRGRANKRVLDSTRD